MKKDPSLFLDTSALIALINRRDQYHVRIRDYLRDAKEVLAGVTSNLVLAEFVTFFSRHGALPEAIQFHQRVLKDPHFRVIWIDAVLHQSSLQVLEKFSEQHLSFTDASSVALMRREKIDRVLAFDEDFHKIGFEVVP